MENNVKCMQDELIAVKTERENLEQHKQITVCLPPVPPSCPYSVPCTPCAVPCSPCVVPCADFQMKELKEQYIRLQDDFKNKVTEVAGLRADNERFKHCMKEAEETKKNLEQKIKEFENNFKNLKGGDLKNKV